MSLLAMNNVTTAYGKAVVLQNVSLKAEEGEISALLGSNGSGKTTVIKTVLGLVRPKEGTIEFDGKQIQGMPPYQVNEIGISVAPEGRKIFPEMTVVENLRMGCFHEERKEVIQERMEEIFGLFPRLKERRNQLGGTLSGGEQGMLSLGRALMGMPRLMILDEPSLGLQPNLVERMFEMIQRINQEWGTTILLAEQNARKTLEIANSGYVVQKGRIIAQGTAAEIAENEVVKKAYLKADKIIR
ncbi:MAG: ATP-binding cassette domain-containing protein [Proteobacteria bacterium]|nr:ATP-binding cassette domain-containing protein [Pseudomonadota bacterium]NIS61286.1 ATP-binding cassette domain-containing protein [Pseudomonadota bacterium]NIS69262.1 ATP-binding cassette domain-containing protein [Pseudomonadota bacterium]